MTKLFYTKLNNNRYHIGITDKEVSDAMAHMESEYPDAEILETIEFTTYDRANAFKRGVIKCFIDNCDVAFIGGKATQVFDTDVMDLEPLGKSVKVFGDKPMVLFRDRMISLRAERA